MASKGKVIAWVAAAGISLALPFIAKFEGRENVAYLDTGNVATVCVGHTGPEVRFGDVWTDAACDAALASDVQEASECLYRNVTVMIGPHEHAAYTSFVFNVGCDAFAKSTLLKRLNASDHVGACDELLRWVYDNGKKLNGLVRRRHAERNLCLGEL